VKTDDDTEGFDEELERALTIKPTKMDGFATAYKGDINVRMSNNDHLRIEYKNDGGPSSKTFVKVTVNG